MGLVVLRHVRRGDEDAGLAHGADLGDRAGAGARNDDVRRGEGQIHPLDEIEVPYGRDGVCRHEFVDAGFIIPAALPDDFDAFSAGAAGLDPGAHRLVQRAAAEGAADDEKVLLLRVQAVELHGLGAHLGGRGRGDFLADGVAAQDDLVRREEAFHALVRHADALDLLAEHLVGHAGEAVLLLDQRRDMQLGGGLQQGSAGIAADADGDVGLEVADDFPRLAEAGEQLERHLDVVEEVAERQLALESRHGEADDLVARGGHLLHLHLAVGADEEDFVLRAEFPELVGDGHGREDVASRAAAADDDSKGFVLHG